MLPDKLWVAYILEPRCYDGIVLFAVIKDPHDRKVVGWPTANARPPTSSQRPSPSAPPNKPMLEHGLISPDAFLKSQPEFVSVGLVQERDSYSGMAL